MECHLVEDMLKYIFLILLLFNISCSRYITNLKPHDPHSYCLKREFEVQVLPSAICSSTDAEKCNWGTVAEFRYKCTRWSSW